MDVRSLATQRRHRAEAPMRVRLRGDADRVLGLGGDLPTDFARQFDDELLLRQKLSPLRPAEGDAPWRHEVAYWDNAESRAERVKCEPGQEGGARPAIDEAFQREVVIGTEGVAGGDPGGAQLCVDQFRASTGARSDELCAVEIGERGERRRGRCAGIGEVVAVLQKFNPLQLFLREREECKREVEFTVEKQLDQVSLFAALDKAEREACLPILEFRNEARQDSRRDALKSANPNDGDLGRLERCKVSASVRQPRGEKVGMGDKNGASRCQRRSPAPAASLDQPMADELLESCDLMADGGLGVAKSRCRPSEGAGLGHRLKGRELAQTQLWPNIDKIHQVVL